MAPKGKGKGKGKSKPTHRKTTASASAARIIPPEVTSDILSRLPVKTLLRFKNVSKQWRTIVSLPRFISAHLTRSPASLIIHAHRAPTLDADEPWTHNIEDLLKAAHTELHLDADQETQETHPDGNVITVYGPPGPKSTVTRILDFPGSDAAGFERMEVIGAANGIVCVSQHVYATKLTLWNPATRFSRPIPRPGLQPNPAFHCNANIGLAFDPSCNDYKLIRILCHHTKLFTSDVAEVFSLKSGRWEPLDQPGEPIPFKVSGEKCGAVIRGVPYWACLKIYPDLSMRPTLLSFDVRRAAFDVEPLRWFRKGKRMCIGEVREGFLGAVAWDGGSEETENQVIDVWMRDEEGAWSNIYRAGLVPVVGKVVGFYGDRLGIVVEVGGEGNLSMLSLEKEEMEVEDFINVEGSVMRSVRVVNYRASLSRIPEIGKAVIQTRFDAGGKNIRRDRAKKRNNG